MRRANNLSEWQLQAVLFRARLTQYYETFISQGGDDIDQIMQCDEQEFLEIMSLVGMASKPLHVRRLQRTLNEFSLNRAQFLLNSVAYIGPPPVDFQSASVAEPSTSTAAPAATAPLSVADNLATALQFLVPGFLSPTAANLDLSTLNGLIPHSTVSNTASVSTTLSHSSTAALLRQTERRLPSASATSQQLGDGGLLGPLSPLHRFAASSAGVPHSASTNALPFPDNVLMSLVSGSGTLPTSATAVTSASLIPPPSVIGINRHRQQHSAFTLSGAGTPPPPPKWPTIAPTVTQLRSSESESVAVTGIPPPIDITAGAASTDALLTGGDAEDASSSRHSTPISSTAYPLFEIAAGDCASSTGGVCGGASTSSSAAAAAAALAETATAAGGDATLSSVDLQRLAEYASSLSGELPQIEPKFVQNKKKISKELLDAMSLAVDHPQRATEFRRFSAIYGRFDAKRRPDKPLTFHEALVNEAAAQLCMCRAELLTRRDELFPLARKLVRMAGYRGLRSGTSRRRRRRQLLLLGGAGKTEPQCSVRHLSAVASISSATPCRRVIATSASGTHSSGAKSRMTSAVSASRTPSRSSVGSTANSGSPSSVSPSTVRSLLSSPIPQHVRLNGGGVKTSRSGGSAFSAKCTYTNQKPSASVATTSASVIYSDDCDDDDDDDDYDDDDVASYDKDEEEGESEEYVDDDEEEEIEPLEADDGVKEWRQTRRRTRPASPQQHRRRRRRRSSNDKIDNKTMDGGSGSLVGDVPSKVKRESGEESAVAETSFSSTAGTCTKK